MSLAVWNHDNVDIVYLDFARLLTKSPTEDYWISYTDVELVGQCGLG